MCYIEPTYLVKIQTCIGSISSDYDVGMKIYQCRKYVKEYKTLMFAQHSIQMHVFQMLRPILECVYNKLLLVQLDTTYLNAVRNIGQLNVYETGNMF